MLTFGQTASAAALNVSTFVETMLGRRNVWRSQLDSRLRGSVWRLIRIMGASSSSFLDLA